MCILSEGPQPFRVHEGSWPLLGAVVGWGASYGERDGAALVAPTSVDQQRQRPVACRSVHALMERQEPSANWEPVCVLKPLRAPMNGELVGSQHGELPHVFQVQLQLANVPKPYDFKLHVEQQIPIAHEWGVHTI